MNTLDNAIPIRGYIDHENGIQPTFETCQVNNEENPYFGNGSIYGNGPEGEFYAIFVSALPVILRKGAKAPDRLVVGFALFLEDKVTAIRDAKGERMNAVAVCNLSPGNNSKSKPYKIRDAMLMPGELSDIQLARGIPLWGYFGKTLADGSERIFKVRVRHVTTNGRRVSLVSAICRPGTTDQWIEIEGKFEGSSPAPKPVPLPFWLDANGNKKNVPESAFKGKATQFEYFAWIQWYSAEPAGCPWRGSDGAFIPLTDDALKELAETNYNRRIDYDIALIKNRHNFK